MGPSVAILSLRVLPIELQILSVVETAIVLRCQDLVLYPMHVFTTSTLPWLCVLVLLHFFCH